MKLQRIVFGEPKPGGPVFATLLKGLDESISYCNYTGPLQHDRVTDVPLTVPILGLNFRHPTDLKLISAPPATGDHWGMFAWHHVELYVTGAKDGCIPEQHQFCVGLCRDIYVLDSSAPQTWDEFQVTAGVCWGLKFQDKTAYVVFRGSDDKLDWLRDLTGIDHAAEGVVDHDKFGRMWDGFVIGMAETWKAIKPLLAGLDAVVFTGHSLGAAHADVAAGLALLELNGG